jgi:Protein of unknown function (DUF2752)
MSSESFKALGKVGWYILLPLAFGLVPSSWFESRPSMCLIRRVFGVRCPGCGMSRAISCVFHADFKKAFQYNRLVVVVFPLLCYVWLKGLMVECSKYNRDRADKSAVGTINRPLQRAGVTCSMAWSAQTGGRI